MDSPTAQSRKVFMTGHIYPPSETPQERLARLRHEAANTVMSLGSRPDTHPELMAWCEILETCDRALGNPPTPAKQMFARFAYDGGKEVA